MRPTKRGGVLLSALAAAVAAAILSAPPARAQFYNGFNNGFSNGANGGFGRQGNGYLAPMPSGMGPFAPMPRGSAAYPMSQPTPYAAMPYFGSPFRSSGSFGFMPSRADSDGSPYGFSFRRSFGNGFGDEPRSEGDVQPEYSAPHRETNAVLPPDQSSPLSPRPDPPRRVQPGGITFHSVVTAPPGGFEIYGSGSNIVTTYGPALLGGYYYGAYCNDGGAGMFPSVFSAYDGFPAYIDSIGPGVSVAETTLPAYAADPQDFSPPVYNVTYNQTNYYVASPSRADEIEDGGAGAKAALKQAYPADSYQAAFADIEKSWTDGDISLIKKHFRSDDTKISVFLTSAYKYSLNSSDFAQITRDAFDKLTTVSFKFTELQKATNGDITAYGTHVYRSSTGSDAAPGALTPFDADADTSPSADGSAGQAPAPDEKTVYVSYTLRHGDNGWYIVSIDSSRSPLVDADKNSAAN